MCSLKSCFNSRSTDSELRPIQIYAFKKMSLSVLINQEYILRRQYLQVEITQYLQVEITRYNTIIGRMILSSVFDRKRIICKCLLLSMIGYCLCCCGFLFCVCGRICINVPVYFIISHESKMESFIFYCHEKKTTLKLTKKL